MNKQNRYIIWRANWNEKQGWRTFSGSRSLTGILQESFFSSDKTVPLPVDAIERIQQWAKDNQVALLDKTHKSQEMSFIETQRQSWLVAVFQAV